MRKAYILKRLTGQVKRLAALMLITLMAVGNVFAQYQGTGTFTKINSQAELTTGYYVITDVNGEAAMLNEQGAPGNSSYIQRTTDVTIVNDGISNPDASIVWLVTVNAGTITIYNEAAQVYAASSTITSKNYACLIAESNDLSHWTPVFDNGWSIQNVQNNDRYLRYNPSNGQQRFSCYKLSSYNMDLLNLYKMESGDAPVAVAAPTFSLPTGTYYTPQTVTLTAAADANVYYAINGGEPVLYNAPFTVNATSVITAYAVVGETTSPTSTVTLTFPVQLANIAAFYAAENGLYQITGDLTFVYRNGVNMYVQDATGGLLVYDNQGIITNEYDNGDVISGCWYTLCF